jgi:endonuclease/exonuclease/phosphatase family metal-dependent hydrolase
MKIVSFNVRCAYREDGINSFIHRAGLIYDKVMQEKPEVIAFQEVTEPILPVLERLMSEYQFVGQFRNEDYTGEGLFTAIRKDAVALIGLETIWLSPTPYVAGSRFAEQSPCPRICVMTQLRLKESGELFRVFNVHLDYVSDAVCADGIQCALNFVKEYDSKKKLPNVLLGDFNVTPDSNTVARCNVFGDLRDVTTELQGTFHVYGEKSVKIDYVYLSEEWSKRVKNVALWDEVHEEIYLSDHYPVAVELK